MLGTISFEFHCCDQKNKAELTFTKGFVALLLEESSIAIFARRTE